MQIAIIVWAFCCLKCSCIYNNRLVHENAIREYYKNPNYCLECGKIIKVKEKENPGEAGRRKFCSLSCSAIYNNAKRGNGKPKYCNNCGKELFGRQKWNSNCCSHSCTIKYKQKTKIQSWLSGKWNGTVGVQTIRLSKRVKDYLKKEAGYKCEKCGWNEVNPILGKPILTISHIDGNPENNKRENLEVLCFNCHTLTKTFGSLNIGNGRKSKGMNRK